MAHRHREVSRVEGFSDAVFGFAITLLVVSLEVPKTFSELLAAMRGFPAFAVCFAMLFQVWRRHYKFFRAYDLEDGPSVALTGLLLFVVLFYVYPLKFLWSVVFTQIGFGGHGPEEMLNAAQSPMLFEIYGAGVAAVFGILAAMYTHAYRQRVTLGLTPLETLETRRQIYSNIGLTAIALMSVLIAFVAGRVAIRFVSFAGYVYFLIGFVEWGLGEWMGRARKQLASKAGTSPA